MSKLRVLHITFDMAIGGTEQVIRQLILNLPAEIECQILCIDGRIGDIGLALQQQGTTVHTLSRKAGLDWQLIRNIRELIRKERIDIVHCHQYTPWVYGWFAHWRTKAKVIFTEHGRFHPDRTRWKAAPLNVIMAISSSQITAISHATKRALTRHEFVPGFLIKVIYNGVVKQSVSLEEVEQCRRELLLEEKRVIGTIARLDHVKNQAMMLKAFKLILSKHPRLVLLLVGDGPERERLEQQCKLDGIASSVIFAGFKQQPGPYLAMMDIYLLSSYTEGTSMTLLEAMSLKIPCVATAVGGNPEIVIDGLTGLLAQNDDAQGFAAAIETLLEHDILRKKCGDEAFLRFGKHFSVSAMTEQFIAMYRKLN
jgi:glycosyltransferase involved in cell wall biosynthesis